VKYSTLKSDAYKSVPPELQEAITKPRGMMGRDATKKFGEVYTGRAIFSSMTMAGGYSSFGKALRLLAPPVTDVGDIIGHST
jgi:hypothetical protein